MFSVIAWLGSLSSVPTLWFSLFISKLKYWPHRSLISSPFIKTSPFALLTLRIWHMSMPDRSLQLQFDICLAVLQQFPVDRTVPLLPQLSLSPPPFLPSPSLSCTLPCRLLLLFFSKYSVFLSSPSMILCNSNILWQDPHKLYNYSFQL